MRKGLRSLISLVEIFQWYIVMFTKIKNKTEPPSIFKLTIALCEVKFSLHLKLIVHNLHFDQLVGIFDPFFQGSWPCLAPAFSTIVQFFWFGIFPLHPLFTKVYKCLVFQHFYQYVDKLYKLYAQNIFLVFDLFKRLKRVFKSPLYLQKLLFNDFSD